MSWRSNRFSNGLHSLDWMMRDRDASKMLNLSDRGAGAARVVRKADTTPESITREEAARALKHDRRIEAVCKRLRRTGLGHLIPVLLLICRNGRHRVDSIREISTREQISWEAAKARYFGHREKLENFFCAQ